MMSKELIVAGFAGTQRASEVLSELQRLNANWTADLADGFVAYRTDDGQLRLDQSVSQQQAHESDLGALLNGILGMLLTAPFTSGLSVVAAGSEEADQWEQPYGVSRDFVSGVGQLVQPGHSAVFAQISTGNPDVVAEHFRALGAKILRTPLSPRPDTRSDMDESPRL